MFFVLNGVLKSIEDVLKSFDPMSSWAFNACRTVPLYTTHCTTSNGQAAS